SGRQPEAAGASAASVGASPPLAVFGRDGAAAAEHPPEEPLSPGQAGSVLDESREVLTAATVVPVVTAALPLAPPLGDDAVAASRMIGASAPVTPAAGPPGGVPPAEAPTRQIVCTTPQLRRFIKSRAYLPMHEIRRRFAIDGSDDDVTAVTVEGSRIFVGLPEGEGRMLGELLSVGEVGFELSHDPATPVVVGVFPMRPIPRP
ncbi:MAG: hypothetical protein ACYDCI_04995, partial [Candidatus Limnocylindrales bacterium]